MVSSCFLAVFYSLCRHRSPPFHFLCSPSPSSILAGEHHLHCSSSGRFECAESFATSMRSTLTRSRRPISSKSSASRLLPRGRPSWPSSSPPLWPAYSGCSRYCLSLVCAYLCAVMLASKSVARLINRARRGSLPPCCSAAEPRARVARSSRATSGRAAVILELASPPRCSTTHSIAAYEHQPAGNRVSPASSVLKIATRDFVFKFEICEGLFCEP